MCLLCETKELKDPVQLWDGYGQYVVHDCPCDKNIEFHNDNIVPVSMKTNKKFFRRLETIQEVNPSTSPDPSPNTDKNHSNLFLVSHTIHATSILVVSCLVVAMCV